MASRNNDEVEALRALVKDRHRAATKKVSRIERVRKINVRGSQFDPRRDLKKVNRYTKTQLTNYLGKLEQFNARSMNFVQGHGRAPIPKEQWQQYKAQENKVNRRLRQAQKAVGDIKLPNTDMTISERIKMMDRIEQKGMKDRSHVIPLQAIKRTSKGIVGEKGLQRIYNDIGKRLEPDYIERMIKSNRTSAEKMAAKTGNSKLAAAIASLTDEQLYVAWNYTALAKNMALNYENDGKEDGVEFEDSSQDNATELVTWAGSLSIGRGFRNNNRRK